MKQKLKQVFLDGIPTVERDIKATFPVIIYHAMGIDYWQQFHHVPAAEIYKTDPYYLEGYTDRAGYEKAFRSAIKVVFNSAINTTNNGDNLGWLTKIIRYEHLPLMLNMTPPKITKEVAAVVHREAPVFIKKFIRERHHLLKDYFFYAPNGLQAMNLESKVALKVIETFVNLNKPILTVFDSFIVKAEDDYLLKNTIVNCYWRTTGFAPAFS